MGVAALVAITICVELFVLWRLRFDRFVVAIVIAGTLLWLDYLTYTSISDRNYDGPSQLEYIESIANLRLPDVFSCAVCGHPPLYYALAAFWSKTVLAFGWLPLELGLQWLSLLLFFSFVVFALLVFRNCGASPTTLRLATALVVFWPSSVINSIRVHNDALASPLMLATVYFIAKWDDRRQSGDFAAALVLATLAILCKASGYAVAAALLLFLAVRFRSRDERHLGVQRFAFAVLIFATTAVLATGLRSSRLQRTPCQLVVGTACNGRYVPPIPDTPARFLSFHPVDFVSRLQLVPEDPFLNRFAKSSLFGVMPLGESFADTRHQLLARGLSGGLLGMVAVCLLGLPQLRGASLRKYRVYLVSFSVMLLFLLAFRLRAPNEFHEDFRHIFPALVPFCLGYATLVGRAGRYSKIIQAVGVAGALAMIGLSVAFFARMPP